MSVRQKKKQARASEKDKWGFSKSLSRSQRRALRKRNVHCSYGNITLTPGQKGTAANGMMIHGGGSMK